MVEGNPYTLEDIQTIRNGMGTYAILSEDTIKKITELETIMLQYVSATEPVEKNPRKFHEKNTGTRDIHTERRTHNNRFTGDRKRNLHSSTEDNDNWNAGKSFVVTPKLVKDGIEKSISDIRMALNKLTTKNYDVQCDSITKLITIVVENNVISVDSTSDELHRIAKIIFDIASSNKTLSEIYARLYKHLIQHFANLSQNINDLLENYRASLHEIHFMDPNTDYDGYCKYTKTNDTRKAMTLFIVNLMRQDILSEHSVIETIMYLENMIMKYAEEPNRTNEVEEITENLFILITQSINTLKNSEDWIEQIIPTIHELSKLRKTNSAKYPSMSSRASFKYMDILDSIN